MIKKSASEKKANILWKIAVIIINLVILAYLVFVTINDPRWIFADANKALILGTLTAIITIIYLLKIREKKQKA